MATSREKLLASAAKEIYTYGFQGAGLSKILAEAGVPKGSLYHHFKSKKELALAVIEERIAPGMLELFSSLESDQPLQTSLHHAIDTIASSERLITYGCPLNKLIQEMAPLDEDFSKLLSDTYESLIEKVTAAVRRADEKGELRTDNPEGVGRFLFLTIWSYLAIPPTLSSKEDFLSLKPHLDRYLASFQK